MQAAEAAKRKAEEEVGKVRATASAAVDRVEAQLRESQERLQAAEMSAKTREAEVRAPYAIIMWPHVCRFHLMTALVCAKIGDCS